MEDIILMPDLFPFKFFWKEVGNSETEADIWPSKGAVVRLQQNSFILKKILVIWFFPLVTCFQPFYFV